MSSTARDKFNGENAVRCLRLPVTVRTAEMTFLTNGQYLRLLDLTPQRWRTMVTTLSESRMRWGETIALDLDLTGGKAPGDVVFTNARTGTHLRPHLASPRWGRFRASWDGLRVF